jgi:hypothetical protein
MGRREDVPWVCCLGVLRLVALGWHVGGAGGLVVVVVVITQWPQWWWWNVVVGAVVPFSVLVKYNP